MKRPNIYWIDLFSGAGGTSTGIHLVDKSTKTKVIYCVNHDVVAIESHKANHPYCKHLVEDVRDMRVVATIKKEVDKLRKAEPDCIINIWASLECTNYSKAKGGLPRDADSRTLAHALYMYIEALNPDYLYIENVREFMAWGPLDDNGRPISKSNGRDYIKWANKIQRYGYKYDFRLLNSADFGAYTSRLRYFGQFAKKGMPISWPEPTHAKKVKKEKGFFKNTLKHWKAVKDVLDLADEGQSIFSRKIPLSLNTLKRIYAGLIKFVAGGEDMFIQKYFSGKPMGKVISVNGPAGSITTIPQQAPVFIKRDIQFLTAYYSTGKNISSIDSPCPVVPTKDRFTKIKPVFFQNDYSSGGIISSLNNPCPTLLSRPKQNLVFVDQQYGNSMPSSVKNPIGSLTANPKFNLVTTKTNYLFNPSWGGSCHSIKKPSPVIVARQDKAPMYVLGTEHGDNPIPIYLNEAPEMMQIKMFMNAYGIIDIKMRMLKVSELLQIQGFPKDYKLKGTQTEQKKFIGNAVEVNQAKWIINSNSVSLFNHLNKLAS